MVCARLRWGGCAPASIIGFGLVVRLVVVGLAVVLAGACSSTPEGGRCGRECPDGTVCERGTCVRPPCPEGWNDCNGLATDGCEVEVGTDPANCGLCGHACTADHASPVCVEGACGLGTCAAGFEDCNHDASDGCEIDVAGDAAHCGACDTACELPHASAGCVDRACVVAACADGFADCNDQDGDGCEIDTGTDDGNCGMCGHACGADERCAGGTCAPITCTAPLADCNHLAVDGCEVDVTTDAANCGMCDQPCPAGATCSGGTCTYACTTQADDPITGQKCPIETPCTAYEQCGTQLAAPTYRYWYCSPTTHTCQFLPMTGGFTAAAGTCSAQLVVRQLAAAPYDKRIVPPDGVAFRTGTSLAIEVTNTTATDLYLDQLPLTLELAGTNPSRFDVNAVRLYQVGSISDYGDGNNATLFVCSSPTTPFASATSFTLGTGATGGCGGSAFSRVRALSSQRFIVNLAFAASATFIEGRQYRLKIGAPLVGVRARPSTTGASSAVTACPLPATGLTGSYLGFASP